MNIVEYIPDRTKIFLAVFWLWTWILLQFNKACAMLLQLILEWVPDNFVPAITNKSTVHAVNAVDGQGNNITNKLKLFLNLNWDKEMFDGEGGVDIDNFAKHVGSSLIWIAYILEYELSPAYNDFINASKESDFGAKDFNKLLKAVLIDVSTKLVHNLSTQQSSPIMFGEVNFS